MIEHVTEWLGAYHDGELHGARLRQVEQHLVACAACQAELEELENLSRLLHEPAVHGDFLSTERFVANLALKMPRRTDKVQPRSMLNIGWWLAPVSLLGAWLFVEIALSLGSLVSLAVASGVFGEVAWLQGGSVQMSWYAAAVGLFGEVLGAPAQAVLAELNDAHLFIAGVVRSLIPQAVLAVLYLGWLFSWWLRQRTGQPSEQMTQS